MIAAICKVLGYTLGSQTVDQVWYSGTTTTVQRKGETVAQYGYFGKLRALFYCLRHPR